jgi:hypothetical protein
MAEEDATTAEGNGPVTGSATDPERGGAPADGPLARLNALQRSPRQRGLATAVALVFGVAAATVHWGGLLVGGALVGLVQPRLRRAVLGGLGYGLCVLGVAAARFALAGTLGEVTGTWPLSGVGVAIALVAGSLGGLARGLIPDAR